MKFFTSIFLLSKTCLFINAVKSVQQNIIASNCTFPVVVVTWDFGSAAKKGMRVLLPKNIA